MTREHPGPRSSYLPEDELGTIRGIIGHDFVRIFCPPPAIWEDHTETSSYSLWLDDGPEFVSIYAIELAESRFRIAIERNSIPRDFPYDVEMNMVRDCSDIWFHRRFVVAAIDVLSDAHTDVGLIVRDNADNGFVVITNDAIDEVSLYRLPLSRNFTMETRVTLTL